MNYTPEQKIDIQERVEKAAKYLAELELGLQAQLIYENDGNDRFVTRTTPYLADLKYKDELISPASESLGSE